MSSRCVRRPSSSSVVRRRNSNRARFLTAGVIDSKLHTHIPHGCQPLQNTFDADPVLGVTTRGPKPKTYKVHSRLNRWSDHRQICIVGTSIDKTRNKSRVFDLTFFSRSQGSKLKKVTNAARFFVI